MWYPTDHVLGLPRNGVNHVGMETPFRTKNVTEPVQFTTYPVTSATLLQKYADLGMRSARVVFSWESVQKNPDPLPRPFVAAAMGAVPFNMGGFGVYWTNLAKLIIRLIDRGVYVTVGPWQYNKDAVNGNGDTDITYNDKFFDKEHFADFWGKFATAINQAVAAGFPPDPEFPADPSRPDKLAFDLINEPHAPRPADGTVGITVADWVACAQAAIQAIRANPANTNTIFVEGMGYASPTRDTHRVNPANPQLLWELLNDQPPTLKRIGVSAHCYEGTVKLPGAAPSAKPTNAMRNAFNDLVVWARQKGFKVHIGEVALDAGVNGCSDIATATAQWNDWTQFCLENDDVLVGWNWWGNTSSTWGWSLEGSCSDARNWALTQNNGATWSTYVDVMRDNDSIPVPELVIRDNLPDTGSEPNPTTMIAWESPDIWVRKTADGVVGDDMIVGGSPSVVYVRVTNRGDRDYPNTGNDVVALYWAKASTALSIPEPWNGQVGGVVPNPIPGGMVGFAAVGTLAKKTSKMIPIAWPTTPNPADYPVNDGHFCLLAVVTKSFNPLVQVTHEGFDPPLSPSVLKMNNVAWHNIHIAAPLVRRRR
jgi:aryl-phospho-beta-D-glucosidase BglC (GH1 family)